ncbi:General alpha-glucoside permease [Lasiodiplodia hormozganensis]|uniref:General alpha-glucoside permease n=1 Tax=Lasiodiplodia hormozganensis TaxID=869390 RepID=A0AA40D332_9PEZI|nr:General alpha-glucoside permease [Lasiodiplodia hormozganensis]
MQTANHTDASEPKVVAIDTDQVRRMSVNHAHLEHLARDAANATHAERQMTLWQGLKTYPYAVGWSVFLSTCIIMEGFDKVLVNSLFAYEPFQKTFGVQLSDGTYQLTASWQSAISTASLIGEIMGLAINGIVAERFGYRKSMIATLVAVIGFIFIVFFAENAITLIIGQILCGIPWGVFQTITTTYAAEVCPVALRAYLTTYINLCWVIGQLIASSVLRGMLTRSDKWGYKIPFALQWVWPIPIIIGLCFAPESPWWLIRRERRDDARKALLRLTSSDKDPNFNADETVAMMELTNELEKANSVGTSYKDCFRKTDLRRTEVVAFTWAIQTLCGASSFMGFSTYFYQQAGMSTDNSFTMSMGQYALGAVGTIFSWALMGWCGRRTLYFSGQIGMFIMLTIIGCLGIISRSNTGAQWAIGSCLLVYTFIYDATVGPVCYSLVAELSSNRLRAKTVVLARILYDLINLITNIITPRMLNPSAWNWGAKAGFFWAGSSLICIVWTYFRLPEPKGRTFAELDVLFEKKVPARKFKTTVVDQFVAAGRSTSSSSMEKETLKVQVERVDHE